MTLNPIGSSLRCFESEPDCHHLGMLAGYFWWIVKNDCLYCKGLRSLHFAFPMREKGNNFHLSVSYVMPEMLRHEHISLNSC